MIRPATPADAPALARVLGDWIRETEWMPVLHSREDDINFLSHLIVNAHVWSVGTDGFVALKDGVVPALYLAPGARGRGYGAQLLDRVKQGSDALSLWTFQANAGARRFYAREGFTEIEHTDGSGNDEGLPDVRLEWRRS